MKIGISGSLKALIVAPVVSLLISEGAQACAVCMGSADAELAPAINASMMFLLVAIAAMASGFFIFFIYLARRDGLPASTEQESQG